MDSEIYILKTSATLELRGIMDGIKQKRGVLADSEMLRVLIQEEAKRLGVAPCTA